MFSHFKGTILATLISIIFLLIGVIAVVNISGGISVSPEKVMTATETFQKAKIEVSSVKLKIGLNATFIASDFSLNTPDIKLNAGVFSFKKSFFSLFSNNNQGIFDASIENANSTILLQKGSGMDEGFSNFSNFFNFKDLKNIEFKNTNFILNEASTDTNFKIEGFEGGLKFEESDALLFGVFRIGASKYNLSTKFEKEKLADFKLESENISLKVSLEKNVGKIMFSIHNLTKFLNDITPDTININLNSLDGKKNIVYMESDISYNEVKKVLNFTNSKVQAFGGKEESIQVENLANNKYKVVMNLEEFTLMDNGKLPDLMVNDSKIPLVNFSAFAPSINIILLLNVKQIIVKNEAGQNKIEDIMFNGDFGFGKILGSLNFKYNNTVQFKTEGFIENYENANRKGFFRNEIEFKEYDFSNFSLNENLKLKLKNEEGKMNFDYIISGESAIVNDINIKFQSGLEVISSKYEYNLYNPSSFILILNAKNFDFKALKLVPSANFQNKNEDLFRILFDTLKANNISYINLNCISCKIGDKSLDLGLKSSTSQGKIELEEMYIMSEWLDLSARGMLDIRNPGQNISNLEVNISKWEDFHFKKLFSLSDIFEDTSKLKLPSLETFSGLVSLNLSNLNNKLNKIESLNLTMPINLGILRVAKSELKINGITNKDFLTSDIALLGNVPTINSSASFSGVQVQEIMQSVLRDEKFEGISGFASFGIGFSSRGFLLSEIIQNAIANIEVKSKMGIQGFNLEGIIEVLLNENLSFKKLSNTDIQSKINGLGRFEVNSIIKFANMEFEIEATELKSPNSTTIFVGKLNTSKPVTSFQILGKTATVGANLNNSLRGTMPIYLTSSIFKNEEKTDITFDYSQINKYSEARRVLYK